MGVKVRSNKGKWWIFIDHNKKRKSICVGESKAAAETLAAKITLRLKEGDVSALDTKTEREQPLTFRQYSERWIKNISGHLKGSSIEFYEKQLVLHLVPAIGDKALTDLSRRHFRDLIGTLRTDKKLKTKTITGVVRTASACLTCAVDDELIQSNPATALRSALKRPKDEQRREPKPFTVWESEQLIQTAREHFPAWTSFLMMALDTGMRPNELYGLQWSDIDFKARKVNVQRGIVSGKFHTKTPKNGKARTIDLTVPLCEALEAQLKAQRETYFAKGEPMPVWVFANGVGKHQRDSWTGKVFRKIVKKAGLGEMHILYDCRHSFASQMLAANVPITAVAEAMGHSSATVTLSIYARWVPRADSREVDRLTASRRIPDASLEAISRDSGPIYRGVQEMFSSRQA